MDISIPIFKTSSNQTKPFRWASCGSVGCDVRIATKSYQKHFDKSHSIKWNIKGDDRLTLLKAYKNSWSFLTVKANELKVAREDSANVKDAELVLIFNGLVKKWREETGGSSLIMRRYAHTSYQMILVLGGRDSNVVKLILHELQTQPDMWFEALRTLTNKNPAESAKSFSESVQAWLDWGKAKKLIS